ncbi:hypothetical protein MMA231_03722 (plasmid) [Asticcacaulis sp. MM231]|uniref:ROK family transcriptional regulator n=1 Tax=Asticcacaulis sp. MM231 TaxID=3157666 RepID=UPI0032D5B0F8
MAHKTPTSTGRVDGLSGTNLSKAGDYNQRVVLQAIRAKGDVTRLELAKLTGLSHQSVFNICRRLIDEGTISEVGRTSGGRGQPATRVAIKADGAFALGLNIDRDHMTLVLMDLSGEVKYRIYADKHFALPHDVLEFLRISIDDILKKNLIPKSRLIGLGVAIPDRLGGVEVAERPKDYDQWSSFDFLGAAQAALMMPVYRENDATSAAIGEAQFGRGINHTSFVYILISAGLGCGLIINGRSYAGSLTHAGEIGNIPIVLRDGSPGTLWNVVSLYALYVELEKYGIAVDSPDDLSESDQAMQPAIDAWVEMAADAMLQPFLAITYILSPNVHFIGGQLPHFITIKLCDALNIRTAAQEGAIPLTRFEPSTTSKDAAALGAAVLVIQSRLLPRVELLTNDALGRTA